MGSSSFILTLAATCRPDRTAGPDWRERLLCETGTWRRIWWKSNSAGSGASSESVTDPRLDGMKVLYGTFVQPCNLFST